MTLNFRKIALTGTIALGTIVGAMAPAFSMSVSEYYAFVKDCHSRGGTTGVYENGQLGCRGGVAAVDIGKFEEALVPSKEQISKLSIKKLPKAVRHDVTAPALSKAGKVSRGRLANDWAVSE